MFKKSKRFASAALAGVMTLSLCQSVMAEEKPISIQVNGVYAENLTTAPYIKDNSVHISSADAKTLFGAELSPDTDVALREVAEKEGYTIGWDAENKAVVAVDKAKLLEDIGEFTIMDKYMDYSRKFSEDNYMLEGTFNITYNDKSTAGSTAELGKITGTISGVSSDNKVDMSTVMSLNLSEKLLSEMTESDKNLIKSLQNINIQYKADLNECKIYLNSPEIQKILGVSENAWACLDLQQLFNSVSTTTSFNFTDLLNVSIEGSYKDTNKMLLDMMSFNTVNDYEIAKNTLSMFSDNTFTKNGNVYTSKSTIGDATTGVSESILTLTVDENGNVIAYDMTSTTNVENALNMTFKISADKDNNMPTTFNFEIPGLVSMNMDMNLKYTTTDKAATGIPDSNAQIINLTELILSNMTTYDTATEVNVTEVTVTPAA